MYLTRENHKTNAKQGRNLNVGKHVVSVPIKFSYIL